MSNTRTKAVSLEEHVNSIWDKTEGDNLAKAFAVLTQSYYVTRTKSIVQRMYKDPVSILIDSYTRGEFKDVRDLIQAARRISSSGAALDLHIDAINARIDQSTAVSNQAVPTVKMSGGK